MSTILGARTGVTAFVGYTPLGPVGVATTCTSIADYDSSFGGLSADSELGFAVHQFFVNGGSEALVVRVPKGATGALPGTEELVGSAADSTGLSALPGGFDILCVPDATRAGSESSAELDAGLNQALVLVAAYDCCARHGALLLVDPPPGVDDPDAAVDWFNGLPAMGASAVAIFPRVRIADPTASGQLRLVAPSGTVAGVYARTDGAEGVWKSPSGVGATLLGLDSLAYVLNGVESGALDQLGLSCLRRFPATGPVNWGARTIDSSGSDWKYVAVRRLGLFIEASIRQGTQWVVFEPNEPQLWMQLRLDAEAFMHDLFLKGAFVGQKPLDAYFVKCDASTTDQSDIDNGVVNITIGFAPLKPAEFVLISIRQLTAKPPPP